MMAVATEDRLLFVEEVASTLRVSEETVRRWIREGRISAVRPGAGKTQYRIRQSELDRMLNADTRRAS